MTARNKQFWLWRFIRVTFVSAMVLATIGLVVSPLQRIGWQEVKSHQPELNLNELEGALGQGLLVGLLGGFRTIIADLLYIQMNTYWEEKDRPKTETMIQLVTSIDPRPMFFWRNGSRIIAYDIPVWRIRELGSFDEVPESVQNKIYAEQAERGLAVIDKALQFHPDNPHLYIEKAQVYLNKLKDRETASKYYLKASEQPNAPYYAGRIYAEMLRQLGRKQEALDHLKSILPDLDPDEPAALRHVVLERIRDLEEELGIPYHRRTLGAMTPAATR